MLEGAIKGNVFWFTDDKGKRQEINQNLSKIAGFIANLYNKTSGRARLALDDKVRMFHIFEGQGETTFFLSKQRKNIEKFYVKG